MSRGWLLQVHRGLIQHLLSLDFLDMLHRISIAMVGRRLVLLA
jgi:hypothetical protein